MDPALGSRRFQGSRDWLRCALPTSSSPLALWEEASPNLGPKPPMPEPAEAPAARGEWFETAPSGQAFASQKIQNTQIRGLLPQQQIGLRVRLRTISAPPKLACTFQAPISADRPCREAPKRDRTHVSRLQNHGPSWGCRFCNLQS